MAKTRYLQTKFWSDSYIIELKPIERYFFLYLLTNEHTNLCGSYELPMQVIINESKLSEKELKTIIGKLIKDGKIVYYKSWIRLVNWTKHQNAGSPQVQVGTKREMALIPQEIHKMLYGMDTVSDGIDTISHLDLDLDSTLPNSTKPNLTEYSSVVIQLTKNLIAGIAKCNSPFRDRYEGDQKKIDELCDKWSADIDKLIRIDKAKPEDVEAIIQWLYSSDGKDALFWRKNILSASKLREQYLRLVAAAQNERQQGPRMVIIS